MRSISWQQVEDDIRKLAEAIWGVNALPEEVSGVKCDIVLKLKRDYWIIIEVSKNNSLAKVREDLAKFGVIKPALISKGIYTECYFVTSGDHPSIQESGEGMNVDVHTLKSFANKFLGSELYINERLKYPFGSAVNPDSGEKDKSSYIPICYIDEDNKKYTIIDICNKLLSGKKIILVGEFGTGKSRCLMEIFNNLVENNNFPPIAINLRDNWGYKRLGHIIRNHLGLLGLSEGFSDGLIRSLHRGNHVLLLDGIDEIGSQSWSGDPARLTEIRKISLEGVRDIISSCSASGILLTGREHYFSSDNEMFECLGLVKENVLKLKCPDEFSNDEISQYIRQNTKLTSIPEWIPRKPLVCQLLTRLESSEIVQLERDSYGEAEFFEKIFDAICERETRINPAIYKDVLKGILLYLAQYTRQLPESKEYISTVDINTAFYEIAGYAPIDESAVLLQRLPYLGRVGSGGAERIFVDTYARDGLRGISLANILMIQDKKYAMEKWIQPIGRLGVKIISNKVTPNDSTRNFIKYCENHGNSQIVCDYISLCLSLDVETIDFHGLSVNNGNFEEIFFIDRTIKNVTIHSSYIKKLIIDNTVFINVQISDCIIEDIEGITSTDKMPDVFQNCHVENFKGAFTTSRISELNISNGQKTLLAIIKKLFFQPGAGRQAEALLRGAENYWDADKAQKIIRYMLTNDIIVKTHGAHGELYIPKRKNAFRMEKIMNLQTNCEDELWKISA